MDHVVIIRARNKRVALMQTNGLHPFNNNNSIHVCSVAVTAADRHIFIFDYFYYFLLFLLRRLIVGLSLMVVQCWWWLGQAIVQCWPRWRHGWQIDVVDADRRSMVNCHFHAETCWHLKVDGWKQQIALLSMIGGRQQLWTRLNSVTMAWNFT